MKKLKNIVQMSLFSIKIVFAAAPVRMLLFMVLTLVSSFIPTIKLAVYRNLFNEAQILIETPELGNAGLMMLYAAIDIGLTFMSWNVIGQIRNYIKTTVNDTYNEKVNRKIFDKLSRVKYDYFLNEETYDLMSRVQGNCRETIFTTSFYFIRVISNFISLVSAFTYMASISPLYAIIGFLVSIPFVGITRKYNMDSYFQKRGQTPEHRKNGYLYNLLMSRNAIKEIRIDESTDYLLEQWKEQNNKLFRESHKLRRKHLYQYTYYDIFYALVRGVVIFLNVLDILKGIRLVGDLTLIINGYAVLSSATEIFGYSLSDFEVNEKLYAEWKEFFDYPEEIPVTEEAKAVVGSQFKNHGLSMSGIRYKYPNSDKTVLDSLNFTVKPGEKIALVGENGCGKTTTVRILLGLLTASEGEFECGTSCKPEEYRDVISCVFQNHINYSGTIRDNIIFGDHSYDEERMKKVCEQVGILKFIENLPEGFDTRVGPIFENSTQLSGGQWQKLAFARALYKKSAELLILDEPTAALDPKTEFDIYDEFLHLTEERAVVLISHRLAFTRLMDRICYMENGRITEEGTHEDLMRLGGKYYELYNKQIELFK